MMWFACGILFVATAVSALQEQNIQSYVEMESMIKRENFKNVGVPSPSTIHEVTFAIKQRNRQQLIDILSDRSNPDSPNYQQWMPETELYKLTRNDEAVSALKRWCDSNGLEMKWNNRHNEYFKVAASIKKWESLFRTRFYTWFASDYVSYSGGEVESKFVNRAEVYHLPQDLASHIHAVFGVSQSQPSLHKFGVKQKELTSSSEWETTASKDVTVSFLTNLYNITDRNSSSYCSQSVFQTANEIYSPSDLALFQKTYRLLRQSPINIGNTVSNSCLTKAGYDICTEGNLDTQYIMGVAQKASTYYWYVSDTYSDPFLEYLVEIADAPGNTRPLVNSISWGGQEQVTYC